MNSERQKREEEIERIKRGTTLSREQEAAFQEEIKKAAATIVEQETERIQKSEQTKRPKRLMSPTTIGLWLLGLGAVLTFSIPGLGGTLIVCGIAMIVWATFLKPSKKSLKSSVNDLDVLIPAFSSEKSSPETIGLVILTA